MLEPKLLLCDCLGSQSVNGGAISQCTSLACSKVHTNLCGSELAVAQQAIQEGNTIIACQQERHVFEELAEELDVDPPLVVDIRDRAGWTSDDRSVAAKMAALVSDALMPAPDIKAVDVHSSGICLIIGKAELAQKAAEQLASLLNVTALVPTDDDPGPFDDRHYDLVKGRLTEAAGALGSFDVRIDAFQQSEKAGRGDPGFSDPQNGARSQCDIILDLSGGNPLFPAHEKREGYLRADPDYPEGIFAAILEASQLVGVFEKPLYVKLDEMLCAHSRAQKTGCTRCLDNCPVGALSPNGDHVSVDTMLCAGCGACSAVCPSGAISYDAPSPANTMQRLENLAKVWRINSDEQPHLLVHDSDYGAQIIRLSARYGRGLPADLIPMQVTSLAAFGHSESLAALAVGFGTVSILISPQTESGGLPFEVELANTIAGSDRVHLIEPTEPDQLDEWIWRELEGVEPVNPILPLGTRRQIARLAAKALNPEPISIALPENAPYGALQLDQDACTLCLACISICPSGALGENPDLPQVRFQEDACLQCGICRTICPESALELEPRFNLSDDALSQQVLNEEEPFACVECGALFGVKSTIMRITEQLAGKHSMFADSGAAKMIQMCENCRVNAAYHSENNPFAEGTVPRPRTTDDYH